MEVIGARGEARTRDTRLKRAVLYLLSYTRIEGEEGICHPRAYFIATLISP